MSERDEEWVEWHVHAYYCPGPFFMGWWAYTIRVGADGVPSPLLGYAWLQYEHHQEWARSVAERYGLVGIRPADRYGDHVARAIGLARPQGLRVLARREGSGPYPYLTHWDVPEELLGRERTRATCYRFSHTVDWRVRPMVRTTPAMLALIREVGRRREQKEIARWRAEREGA